MSGRNIVIYFDDRPSFELLVNSAREAAYRASTTTYHLLTVSEPEAGDVNVVLGRLDAPARRLTETGSRVLQHARRGDALDEILRLAAEAHADVIALRADSKTVAASRVFAEAACSVLLVRPNAEHAESRGFVPHVGLCHECERARVRSAGDVWFCPTHAHSRDRATRVAPV